jgi:hypothetical protein
VLDHYQDFTLGQTEVIQGFASSGSALNLVIDGYEVGASAAAAPIFPADNLYPHN